MFSALGAGGMATVHFGRLSGPAGFTRTVAIKRLHENFARDPDFVAMMLDEAVVSARVRHQNVVATLDVVAHDGELLIVTEYIEGESLSQLLKGHGKRQDPIPLPIAIAVAIGMLRGLQAAHEATGADGTPLAMVHRDVSPHNILVGTDGVPRLLDFGIAKARGRIQTTRDGQVKGKVAYMPPEQLTGKVVDARADVYAAAVVLWEMIVGERLFSGDDDEGTAAKVLSGPVAKPSERRPGVPEALDTIVLRGLTRDRERRFTTARELADALEGALPQATPAEVGAWVKSAAAESLARRANKLAEMERGGARGRDAFSTTPDAGATRSAVPLRAATPATSPTLSTPAGVPPRRRRLAFFVVIPLFASLVVVIVAFGVLRTSDGAPSTTPEPALSLPVVSVPDGPSLLSTASLPTIPTEHVATDAGPSKPPRPVRAAQPKQVRRPPSCDPPYYYDATGVKIPKPECR